MHPQTLEGWYVESLRLSFFGLTEWKPRPIFEQIVDAMPTQITAQPVMRFHQEWGNVSDAYVNITQNLDRLDVVLSDQPTRNTIDPDAAGYRPLFWVGPYGSSIERFDPICERATALANSATRAAYAMSLIRQTENAREAGVRLHEFLPTVAFDPNNDLDLSFQVNRPVRDKEGRYINRLAKWESIQTIMLQVGIGATPLAPLPSKPPIFAARIYIDVSTDAENTSALNNLPELARELRSYTREIAENGDSK
jgi:hypothetical protein